MASTEDCASVLEGFIHDSANLPAEINHMMEEIQAKDKDLQKCLSLISGKDGNIQKHIKMNGSLAQHPKENEYAETIEKQYEVASELQAQKVSLAEKAAALFDRQLKRFDIKLRDLQNDGQLQDGPPLPSVFNRKQEAQKSVFDMVPNIALQAQSLSTMNANAHRMNAQVAAGMPQPIPKQISQISSISAPTQRSSLPATPGSALQQQQRPRERETSLGADNKRRKLGNPLAGINLPVQPSSLRQSSLGPGTPKAGTPTGTSRAGSLPRSTAGQAGNAGIKKATMAKKAIPQNVAKLKKPGKHGRTSSSGRKKGQSPSIRGGRGGTAASEDADSILSSAEPSDTDASQHRSRRGNKKAIEEEEVADEDMEEEGGEEDDKHYCYCNQRSYGEMVACENDDCKYQWFHTGCLNMKKVPDEDEDWYCPTCRVLPEIKDKLGKPKKKK